MQKPHFDTSVSYTVHYHLHNKTIKIHGHVHSILLVISTTGIKRIEAKLTQKNRIVKVASNDSRTDTARAKCPMPIARPVSYSKPRKKRSPAYSSSMVSWSSHRSEWLKSMIVTPESLTRIFFGQISPWSMPVRWIDNNVDEADLLLFTQRGVGISKWARVWETYQSETDKMRSGSSRSKLPT